MDFKNFTQKSIQALNDSSGISKENSNQQITTLHLFLALVRDEDGLTTKILEKLGKNKQKIQNELQNNINKLPKVSGGSGEYASIDLSSAIETAESFSKEMKDEFVSVEHLLYGIIQNGSKEVKEILLNNKITKESFLKVLQEVRGNVRVTTDNPESTYDVLNKYGVDLVEKAKKAQIDPVIGRDEEIRNVVRILSRKTKTTQF